MDYSPRRKKPKEMFTKLSADLKLMTFTKTKQNYYTFNKIKSTSKFDIKNDELLDFHLRPLNNNDLRKICRDTNSILNSGRS